MTRRKAAAADMEEAMMCSGDNDVVDVYEVIFEGRVPRKRVGRLDK